LSFFPAETFFSLHLNLIHHLLKLLQVIRNAHNAHRAPAVSYVAGNLSKHAETLEKLENSTNEQ
jgi:hypothetical protein